MTDERPTDVLGSLPHTRPHRRSQRRADLPGEGAAPRGGTGTPEREAAPTTAEPRTAKPAAGPRATKPAAGPRATKPPGGPRATKPAAGPGATKPSAGPKAAKPAAAASPPATRGRLAQPAQPDGIPNLERHRKPVPITGVEVVGTAVQAAAELAEIGLAVGARAIRRAVSRLPKP